MYTVADDLTVEKQRIGQRLQRLRERDHLSQTQVAEAIEVSGQQLVSDWEHGNKVPGGLNLKKLAKLFKVTSDYILCIVDSEQEEHPARKQPDLLEKLQTAIDENKPGEAAEIFARLLQKKD